MGNKNEERGENREAKKKRRQSSDFSRAWGGLSEPANGIIHLKLHLDRVSDRSPSPDRKRIQLGLRFGALRIYSFSGLKANLAVRAVTERLV